MRGCFFWGGSIENEKMAWIGWEKVLTKTEDGGLNIGSLKAQNLALLGKWWWVFKNDRQELWKSVIMAIYGSDGGFNAPSRAKQKGSCWGTIANSPPTLLKDNVDFKSLFIETQSNQQPSWMWSLETSGEYTMSSLRFHIGNSILPKSPVKWDWNNLVPRKVNILAWRLAYNRLPTRENLLKWGMGNSNQCALCNQVTESAAHLFLSCSISNEVWSNLKA